MSFKVGDNVRHRWANLLDYGTVVEIYEINPENPDHPKPGPWYRVRWVHGGVSRGVMHGDVLVRRL